MVEVRKPQKGDRIILSGVVTSVNAGRDGQAAFVRFDGEEMPSCIETAALAHAKIEERPLQVGDPVIVYGMICDIVAIDNGEAWVRTPVAGAGSFTARISDLIRIDEGWIPWEGGECPVAGNARIELRFRDGSETGLVRAEGWVWANRGQPGDIIAYRIVKPEQS